MSAKGSFCTAEFNNIHAQGKGFFMSDSGSLQTEGSLKFLCCGRGFQTEGMSLCLVTAERFNSKPHDPPLL